MCLLSNKVFNSVFGRNPIDRNKPITKQGEYIMGPNFGPFKDCSTKSTEQLLKIPYETLCITSFDNLKLLGYFFTNDKKTNKTVLCLHGYNSTGFLDFSTIALEYLKRDYNVLLVTNRACGESEGKYTTFGILESIDNMKWIDVIKNKYPDGSIIIHGISLGAASACMMADKDLPSNVKLIDSDCAFTSIKNQFKYMINHMMHLPAFPIENILEHKFKKRIGYNFKTASPINSVAKAKVPCLFIHSEEDRYIPYTEAKKLYDACTNTKEILYFPKGGHALSHFNGKDDYYNAVINFAERKA